MKKKINFCLSILMLLGASVVFAASDDSKLEGVAGSSGIGEVGVRSKSSSVGDASEDMGGSDGKRKTQESERDALYEKWVSANRKNNASADLVANEFQIFVQQSIGKSLPIFGHSLFSNSTPTSFAPVESAPVPSDYTIGPGDELLVSIWGQVEVKRNVVVDRNGLISLPRIGMVSVAGVKYQDLSAHLTKAVSKLFRNFELDVSLGKLRTIQVFIVGNAAHPGSYTVSSLSTLVNAVFLSGGPSAQGSMRGIQLKRGSRVVSEFDLYELLLKGDKSKDSQLLPGDVIYIPPVGALAAVVGSVNSPAIFELKPKETLGELLSFAGGLNSVAAGQKATVERIAQRERRQIASFDLDSSGLSMPMHDGDLVKVFSISSKFENAVTLRGNVMNQGRYVWREGLRVSDLIPDKSSLVVDSYWLKQSNTPLFTVADRAVEISKSGGVSSFRYEVMKRNFSEVNWDYAVIERVDKDLTTNLIPFNLHQAVIERNPEQDLLLQPNDVLTIFSKDDIQVQAHKRTKYVVLEGEFERPGVYQALPNETLRQLIVRVGGAAPHAYLLGATFTRESTRLMQQRRMDEIVERMDAAIQRNATKSSASALSEQDVSAAKAQIASQQALLAKMKQVRATGRIVLELPEGAVDIKDFPDIALEDGDHVHIPSKMSTVNVMGAVYNQNTFVHQPNQTVGDYLAKAGGVTKDGDESDIYLVRVDGRVMSKRQSSSFLGLDLVGGLLSKRATPGDTVVVPEKLEKYSLTKELKDWTQIFYQFAMGMAGMKTLNVIK